MADESPSADVDRLSVDVTIQENTREEGPEAFENYLLEMFHHVYDELDVSVTEGNDA